MSAVVPLQKRVWTEADLQALPDDGYNHELVNGELVKSPKNNPEHGQICSRLLTALHTYAETHRLGAVWDSSTGFWMENENCRAPDISFVAKARLRGLKRPPRSFFNGAPDLAVEVLAPSSMPQEITDRLKDFFASGTKVAWVIHPDEKFVEICRSPTARTILGSGASLDGEDLLPG